MAKRKTKQQRIDEEKAALANAVARINATESLRLSDIIRNNTVWPSAREIWEAAAILHRSGIRADGSHLEGQE